MATLAQAQAEYQRRAVPVPKTTGTAPPGNPYWTNNTAEMSRALGQASSPGYAVGQAASAAGAEAAKAGYIRGELEKPGPGNIGAAIAAQNAVNTWQAGNDQLKADWDAYNAAPGGPGGPGGGGSSGGGGGGAMGAVTPVDWEALYGGLKAAEQEASASILAGYDDAFGIAEDELGSQRDRALADIMADYERGMGLLSEQYSGFTAGIADDRSAIAASHAAAHQEYEAELRSVSHSNSNEVAAELAFNNNQIASQELAANNFVNAQQQIGDYNRSSAETDYDIVRALGDSNAEDTYGKYSAELSAALAMRSAEEEARLALALAALDKEMALTQAGAAMGAAGGGGSGGGGYSGGGGGSSSSGSGGMNRFATPLTNYSMRSDLEALLGPAYGETYDPWAFELGTREFSAAATGDLYDSAQMLEAQRLEAMQQAAKLGSWGDLAQMPGRVLDAQQSYQNSANALDANYGATHNAAVDWYLDYASSIGRL